jgi:RNA polymerase sigma-70 factor, ECF subfamily
VGIRSDLERLYREQGDRLWRAVFLYSGDRELTSDAVAEAFAQALRRGDSIESARSWVWHVSFRIAAGMLKDRRRTAALPPEGTYQLAEEAPDLTAALKTLPPKQRGAVVLRYYAGYSIKETAAILDSTPAAVGVHLTRGRRRLRTLLEERDA